MYLYFKNTNVSEQTAEPMKEYLYLFCLESSKIRRKKQHNYPLEQFAVCQRWSCGLHHGK